MAQSHAPTPSVPSASSAPIAPTTTTAQQEDEDGEEKELSLSEYVDSELVNLVNDPTALPRWKPYVRQMDATCILGDDSHCQLPPLDWKGSFRKAYSVLLWIRPIVGSALDVGDTLDSATSGTGIPSGRERPGDAHADIYTDTDTGTVTQSKSRRLWYRFSTAPEDDAGVGICVQCADWELDLEGSLTANLTAFGLPPKTQLLKLPIHLNPNEWSLIGFSHSFPYLKRPQWTVTVNGTLVGRGELSYPIVDQPLQHATVLQNLCSGGVAVMQPSTKPDDQKSASELAQKPQTILHSLHFQLASMAIHSEIIPSDIQALLFCGGPTLSLQHHGRIVTPLPPIDNWTKGSSLNGPNAGIPLAVHGLALEVQHLMDSVVYYFGATNAKVLRGRIMLHQAYLPGETDATPKVGLLQPSVVRRDEELPTLNLFGNVHLLHALSDFLLHCDNGNVDPNLFESTKLLSIVLLEQGLLPALVLPFFLAQLPVGHGMDLQKPLVDKSYTFLYNLYSHKGEWAAELIQLLSDVVYFGGGRVHEQLLQHGLIHVLASSLRISLLRAEHLQVQKYSTLEKFKVPHDEDAWGMTSHELACPKAVPFKIAQACSNLVAVCCGISLEIDFSPATRLQRSSDLALTAVFGLALNMDLWGKSEAALLSILSEVSLRYGNVQGGQILRRQLPIQSFLDLIRSRLEFADHPEIAARLSDIIQHMLLASLSHRKNISIGEHDIAACMGALSDCPLGSVGTHVILSSLSNILEFCNSDDDQLVQIASRMGRNLVMSQYHDVVAPMLLSRTVFCGERSMSSEPRPDSKWEIHWRMALTLFAWVTSISGPEGITAAQATGSLLLAAGRAGSLKNCLVDKTEDTALFMANLFLPTPTMALMIGARSNADSWTYTDLLADRLQVMMPLVPGFVMSLVTDGEISEKSIDMLKEIISAIDGSFHRVFGVIMQNLLANQGRKAVFVNEHVELVKAARDYVPHLVLVAAWIEYHIRMRATSQDDPTVIYKPFKPQERKLNKEESWVDVGPADFPDCNNDLVLDPQLEKQQHDDESGVLKSLRLSQKCVLSTVTALIGNAMKMGGAESSTSLWRVVVSTLRDSQSLTGGRKLKEAQDLYRDMLCRLSAIILTKALNERSYEWEMWSAQLCGAVARLCDMIEEKELLKRSSNDRPHSQDQILLEAALVEVLGYGREMTGWCQLILPTPPDVLRHATEEETPEPPEITVRFDEVDPFEISTSDSDVHNHRSYNSEAIRHSFVPPDVPGASSKLLLPILQPAFRVLMACLGTVDAKLQVIIPSSKTCGTQFDSFEQKSLVLHLAAELKLTLVAAIVGLSFPNSRDVALQGMTCLRRILGDESIEDKVVKDQIAELFAVLVEEIRARYEGERRRREQALFDAYDDEGDMATEEAESSQEVERMILGGDLIPGGGSRIMTQESEEITFDSIEPRQIQADSGVEDFVMFHETYADSGNTAGLDGMLHASGGHTQLGWDQYKGLGSALEECASLIKVLVVEDRANKAEEIAAMHLKLLSPYLDTWDANTMQEAEDSEVVSLFDESNQMIASHDSLQDSGQDDSLPRSETAADAMSTYIEMASIEKSRLSDFVNTFLPSHRYSCQAYVERYCWSRYFEIVTDRDRCSMNAIWERGIADGNRDIRSRLVTMPCNPQFKRHIPKYLDHGTELDFEDDGAVIKSEHFDHRVEENDVLTPLTTSFVSGTNVLSETQLGRSDALRRASEKVDYSIRTLVQTGNLEIVDITKKEISEEDHPELLGQVGLSDTDTDLDDTDDDVYGDGSLGFPSRDDDDLSKTSDGVAGGEDFLSGDESSNLESQGGITATKVADKTQGTANHHIASSVYSHPPDNSSSILSLLHSSAPALIEKHFDNCLHVKAEGSRKCTVLLSHTHLILEYESECGGLYEGELMAVREEAERQRLIEEAGGSSQHVDRDGIILDKIQDQLERRQKEIAAMRPKSIRWNLSELSHVYLRRCRLRDSALEMFFIPSGGSSFGGFGLFSPATSLFLDFGSGHDGNRRRDEAASSIMRRSPPQTIKQWPDRSGQFLHEQLSRLTMGWVEGRITNFDYLLHLNMLAGRSYNDLCQYPVMPWVLSNYTSEEIPDLTDRANFRDLTKPVGALNPDRLNDFMERFETFADPTIPPFMYGSHYSTSAGVVFHFLVRMHPFAGLHRQLQGGYFDVADRLFSSVPRTWEMCTGYSAAEVKELTPEWYCNPAFLKNSNKFKLGTSQDGELLGDVILPPWAKNSPEVFVEVMRNALESDICSDMLPDWIDLIFGRKQQGPEAIKAHNVFFYLTYYGSVDVAAIEDEGLREATELQIAHFGQCPMQLFVRPHVRRVQKIINFRKLTFYQMLSAYTQGAESLEDSQRIHETNLDGSQRVFGEPLFLPFFSAPESHWIHLDAPPPGPHSNLIAVRLAGVDRCLAIDANGIFHSFRWAWKPNDDSDIHVGENGIIDKGNFIAQRELPRFKTVPRLIHVPSARDDSIPAVAISKTLFASRSVLLVLSDGDGCGGLAMQLVDPAKASVKGEALVPSVHSSRITCISMDPIGTAAGHGGVGGELAIVGSADGGSTLWRFMSSHYLPLRPRIRMRGHSGSKVHAVALSSAIHICASVSQERCCIFSIGNGAMVRSWPPPKNTLPMLSPNAKAKTIFCDTPALGLSVQGFVVTVCKTTFTSDDGFSTRNVITLHLFSLEGVSLGSKALESWRGVPHKISCTPDGTAITVCSGRGVTIHRLSAITPLEFIDEWHITETDELDETTPAAWDVDFGPSLMRPIVAAAACSSGVLRLHALPGISPWSDRHRKSTMGIGMALAKPVGRIRDAVGKGLGFGKNFVGAGKDVGKEVTSEVKERGVGGFLAGTLFRKNPKS